MESSHFGPYVICKHIDLSTLSDGKMSPCGPGRMEHPRHVDLGGRRVKNMGEKRSVEKHEPEQNIIICITVVRHLLLPGSGHEIHMRKSSWPEVWIKTNQNKKVVIKNMLTRIITSPKRVAGLQQNYFVVK